METNFNPLHVMPEEKIDLHLLTDEEQWELHIQDELNEMEEFFSKNYDEMELRLQSEEDDY